MTTLLASLAQDSLVAPARSQLHFVFQADTGAVTLRVAEDLFGPSNNLLLS